MELILQTINILTSRKTMHSSYVNSGLFRFGDKFGMSIPIRDAARRVFKVELLLLIV